MHYAAAAAARAWCLREVYYKNSVWVQFLKVWVFSSSASLCLVGVISAAQGLLYRARCAAARPGSRAACGLAAKLRGGSQHLCNTMIICWRVLTC
jgi:hypothetical protein